MNRSTAFRYTVYHRNDPRVLDLKDSVKKLNKTYGLNRYVKLQARLGKDSPHSWLYGRGRSRSYQTIKLKHGAYFDVYVYDRKIYSNDCVEVVDNL